MLQEVGCCRVSSRVSFSDLNPQLIFAELYGESLAQMEFNHGHSFGGFLGRCSAVRASSHPRAAAHRYLAFRVLGLITGEIGRPGVAVTRGVLRARQDIAVSGPIDGLATNMADQAVRHWPLRTSHFPAAGTHKNSVQGHSIRTSAISSRAAVLEEARPWW